MIYKCTACNIEYEVPEGYNASQFNCQTCGSPLSDSPEPLATPNSEHSAHPPIPPQASQQHSSIQQKSKGKQVYKGAIFGILIFGLLVIFMNWGIPIIKDWQKQREKANAETELYQTIDSMTSHEVAGISLKLPDQPQATTEAMTTQMLSLLEKFEAYECEGNDYKYTISRYDYKSEPLLRDAAGRIINSNKTNSFLKNVKAKSESRSGVNIKGIHTRITANKKDQTINLHIFSFKKDTTVWKVEILNNADTDYRHIQTMAESVFQSVKVNS